LKVEDIEKADNNGVLTRERVLVAVLIVATALTIYICYLLVLPFLPAIIWAIALAVVAYPLHERIERRIPSSNIAAGLSVFIVTLLIVAPTIFVVDRMVREAIKGITLIGSTNDTDPVSALISSNPFLLPVFNWIETHIDIQGELQRYSEGITASASSLVMGSFWAIIQLLITLFVLFYFFRDRRAVLRSLRSLLPLSESEADKVLSRVRNTIQAAIFGTLAVAMIQGALGGLMFWWLGLPAPMLWGVVMALVSIVPMLGSFVIWIPAAIYLLFSGMWLKAIILTVWGTIVVGLIDNILYPMLIGSRIRLHTLAVFFAIIGGLAVFGMSGIILGPVVLSVTDALLEVWRRRTSGGRTADA
jgi:predicted PurR-regulated permease PerM